MDSFWIFLIISAISLIARVLGGKKNQPEPSERRYSEGAPSEAPKSFEELLREIQASKAPAPPPAPSKPAYVPPYQPAPQSYETTTADVEDYDDDLEEEAKELERTDYDYRQKDNIYEVYDKAKREAFQRASLEETLTLDQTDMRFGQFNEYKRKPKTTAANPYRQMIRNPESFKKAFIISEILQRRF